MILRERSGVRPQHSEKRGSIQSLVNSEPGVESPLDRLARRSQHPRCRETTAYFLEIGLFAANNVSITSANSAPCEGGPEISRCARTGKQFDRNREPTRGQQGINSPHQGIEPGGESPAAPTFVSAPRIARLRGRSHVQRRSPASARSAGRPRPRSRARKRSSRRCPSD
jgi:hypothetical protein